MRSIQSFELDDTCCLADYVGNNQSRFDQASRLTHIRISLCHFQECLLILNQLGSQLCSFTVTVTDVGEHEFFLSSLTRLVNKIYPFDISNNFLI